MTLKRFILLANMVILLFVPRLSWSQADPEKIIGIKEVYTLNDLYGMALKQSETIQIAREELLIAEKDKSRALSVLMPRFTAFGGYSISDMEQTTDPDFLVGETYDLKTDSLSWGVRFDQSFTLNGKEISALNISKDHISRREQDLNTVRENLLLDVATAYYNVLRAQKGWEIAKASVQRLEKHKESVNARLKVSDVTLTDMYRAESELSDARAKLIEDKNRFILSKSALRTLVNIPPDFKVMEGPEMDAFISEASYGDEPEQGSESNRSELRSAELYRQAAERGVRLAKGDLWPVLSIEGQYAKTNDTNDGTMSDQSLEYDQDVSGFFLGARLTFTLFDGGLRNAQVKQAYARERQARLAVEDLKKKIGLEIQEARLHVETQKSRLVSLRDKLVFAQRNFNAVSEQFRLGFSNSVDMMDANTLLVASEREVSDAEYGYKLAVLKLRRALGVPVRAGQTEGGIKG